MGVYSPWGVKIMTKISRRNYLGRIKGAEIVVGHGELDNPSMIANRLIWKFESSANYLFQILVGNIGQDYFLIKRIKRED